RDDALYGVEMFEVVVRRRDDDADDEIHEPEKVDPHGRVLPETAKPKTVSVSCALCAASSRAAASWSCQWMTRPARVAGPSSARRRPQRSRPRAPHRGRVRRE